MNIIHVLLHAVCWCCTWASFGDDRRRPSNDESSPSSPSSSALGSNVGLDARFDKGQQWDHYSPDYETLQRKMALMMSKHALQIYEQDSKVDSILLKVEDLLKQRIKVEQQTVTAKATPPTSTLSAVTESVSSSLVCQFVFSFKRLNMNFLMHVHNLLQLRFGRL
ncbi:unnamed protein product [Soboliphyme baturini]|uniref:SPX domain-containing protein n=1 Tax=Soboliphyme baturini TaxID=241478 RepID=A0A183J619_9BILA|nr:unnamed protein product [Soboliphyme baturini]